MGSVTGIELKPDSCVLTGLRPVRQGVEVFAVHAVAPADWPEEDAAIADLLRAARKRLRLPRRARVACWGIPEHGSDGDPAAIDRLRPLVDAGFRIESAIAPGHALKTLAALRPRQSDQSAVAWLALNMHGAAIAIVRGSELLYAHAFDWLYTTGAAGSGAQLLQRYALVARLAPEVRHGVAHVRATHRIGVGTAVTCGDLPDLRSMTMPLIEELDLEVETLDSTEGLEATGPARHERFAELAPAIRLACAAAVPDADARRDVPKRWMAAAAVAALLVTAAGSATYWSASGPDLVAPRSPVPKGPQPVERLSVGPGTASAVAVQPQAPGGSIPPQAEPAPADKQGTPPATVASPVPAHRTGGTGGTPAAPRASAEPLPRVDSVLIDGNRRLAIVGGAILGVGDGVGHRTIARIERSGIVLRDRSGLEVAVPLASFRAIK